MALFLATSKYSVSILRFFFLSHVLNLASLLLEISIQLFFKIIFVSNFFFLYLHVLPMLSLASLITLFLLIFRVFANGPGDMGSFPGQVIPKTQNMVLDASLLKTQQYKVRIKSKVEQSRERSSALPYASV